LNSKNLNSITQAFIFAAGRGERMRPLTDLTPKPLVKIAGTNMLDLALGKVKKIPSINKIIINAYYLSVEIEAHLQKLNDPKIILSVENEKLETGGGVLNAINLINCDQPILLINSDIIWNDDSAIDHLIENYNQNEADILLGVKPKAEFWGYDGNGDFCLNENGVLSKPDSNLDYAFTGLQIIHPRIFKNSPPPPFSMNYFYKKAQNKNHSNKNHPQNILENIKGCVLPGQFFHIGTAPAVEEFENLKIKI
jgi:MurNAc alpha-1-phosphate uridylyltransferase